MEAIAHCVGVEVEYRRLANCEAQIIGYKHRAVVYVSLDTPPHRRRFSAGHELGHWHHHRGQSFVCRSSDIGQPIDDNRKRGEAGRRLFGRPDPAAVHCRTELERMGEISLDVIADLASKFKASVTATAIRAMRMTRQPLILVAHNLLGRNWQWRSITAGRMRVRDDVDFEVISVHLDEGR